jgi:hypothetical protein
MLADIYRNWNKIRASPSRVILFWTIADLLYIPGTLAANAFVYDTSNTDTPRWIVNACMAQGWFLQAGFIARALWGAVMATNIFLAICRKVSIPTLVQFENVYHAIVWGTSLTMACTPLFLRGGTTTTTPGTSSRPSPFYAPAVFWCWVSSTSEYASYRMVRVTE